MLSKAILRLGLMAARFCFWPVRARGVDVLRDAHHGVIGEHDERLCLCEHLYHNTVIQRRARVPEGRRRGRPVPHLDIQQRRSSYSSMKEPSPTMIARTVLRHYEGRRNMRTMPGPSSTLCSTIEASVRHERKTTLQRSAWSSRTAIDGTCQATSASAPWICSEGVGD
jgi:hypothetical protein